MIISFNVFFPTKLIGLIKTLLHMMWENTAPGRLLNSRYLLYRNQSAAARRCACFFLNAYTRINYHPVMSPNSPSIPPTTCDRCLSWCLWRADSGGGCLIPGCGLLWSLHLSRDVSPGHRVWRGRNWWPHLGVKGQTSSPHAFEKWRHKFPENADCN